MKTEQEIRERLNKIKEWDRDDDYTDYTANELKDGSINLLKWVLDEVGCNL